MRWFLGLILVIALVTGVAYGVGRFLLPNTLEVTRTVAIERPRASVFAMINDLRIAKEWSPFYARDPDADYAFSGDAGRGQVMRWASDVREVGRGSMTIVDSIENQEVQSILRMNDGATFDSRIELRPGAEETTVAWTVSAACEDTAINVPCRYMNLILRGLVQKELDNGMARMRTLTEQLPDVNFEGLNPQFDQIEALPFVYSVVETSNQNPEEVAEAEALALNQVQQFMAQYNLGRAGPLTRVIMSEAEGRMTYRVGYPYSGDRPSTVVGVQVGETPSGQAMHVMVEGDGAAIGLAHAQMEAYAQAHRLERREGVLPWHVVHNQGFNGEPARFELFMPLQ